VPALRGGASDIVKHQTALGAGAPAKARWVELAELPDRCELRERLARIFKGNIEGAGKNRSRRWCSVTMCGSAIKARRYYRKKRRQLGARRPKGAML
jgi:CGNR zinc finger